MDADEATDNAMGSVIAHIMFMAGCFHGLGNNIRVDWERQVSVGKKRRHTLVIFQNRKKPEPAELEAPKPTGELDLTELLKGEGNGGATHA